MSGWMGSLWGTRRTTQESARDAIVGLRQQLLMLEKKEEHLANKIDEEMKKARANATTNKRCECLRSWDFGAKGLYGEGGKGQAMHGEWEVRSEKTAMGVERSMLYARINNQRDERE